MWDSTCYVVHDGATLLHEHEKLDMWLPPGGHVDCDELPHEAARRETDEATGLRPELLADRGPYDTGQIESLPRPTAFLLEDIDVRADGRVAHQHVDFVYVGRVDGREVDPAGGDEADPAVWEWFTPEELADGADRFADDVRDPGRRAVDIVERDPAGV